MNLNLKQIAVLSVLLVGIGAVVFFVTPRPLTTVSADADVLADIASFRTALRTDLQRFGGEKMFASLKHTFSEADQVKRHFIGHVFGEELYELEGVAGVAVCDEGLEFGCFHGLFIRAISAEGPDVVEKLDAVCHDVYGPFGTGCSHGIGHGIVEYSGHDDLTRALMLCKKTDQRVPLLGCTSGVFMEYFFPLMTKNGELSPTLRERDVRDVFTPCRNIPTEFQSSCFYELGSWLPHASEKFPRDCENVTGDWRTHCFMGIGSYLANRHYAVEAIRNRCALFSSDDESSCRVGAAWSLYVIGDMNDVFAVCADTSAEREEKCLIRGDFTLQGSLAQYKR